MKKSVFILAIWAAAITNTSAQNYIGSYQPLEQNVEFKINAIKVDKRKLHVYLLPAVEYFDSDAGKYNNYSKWGYTGKYSKTQKRWWEGIKSQTVVLVTVWFASGDSIAQVDMIPNGGKALDCSLKYGDNQAAELKGFIIPGAGVGENQVISLWEGNLHFKLRPREETWIWLMFDVPEDISEVTFKLNETEPIIVNFNEKKE